VSEAVFLSLLLDEGRDWRKFSAGCVSAVVGPVDDDAVVVAAVATGLVAKAEKKQTDTEYDWLAGEIAAAADDVDQ